MPFIESNPSQTVHPVKRRDMLPSIEVDMWGNLVQVDDGRRANHYDGVSRVERFANPLITQPPYSSAVPPIPGFNMQHRQFGSQPNLRAGWQDSPLPAPTSYPQDYGYEQYGPMAFPVPAPYHGPGGWRAPVLEPRHVLLNRVSPEYRYTMTYTGQVVETPTKDEVLQALAEWYVDQVIAILVKPGSFRAGVGGSAEEVWGLGGREREAWERVGRAAPDYSKPWGRMGMTATPIQPDRRPRLRSLEREPHDPWNVLWCNSPTRSPSLVHFVKDVLARMSVEQTSVIAAVWFLGGLGLHDGDGAKGSELRSILRSFASTEVEAVEKRVAMLGLLLAGKWLDDNSFLNKSWTEVTTIPVVQIHQLEIAALQDLHWALYVPLSSWVDHVNKLFSAILYAGESQGIVYTALDDMVSQARQAELADPKASTLTLVDSSRRSSLDVAGEHALSRDWGEFVREYTFESQDVDADRELNRTVSALVDEDRMEEEEDEWGLDYDGATRWLPPMSDLRRSLSGSQSPDGPIFYSRPPPVEPYGHERFHRSSSFGFGLATPGYQHAQVYWSPHQRAAHSSPMYHQKPTYKPTSAPQQAYPTPPEHAPYHHTQRASLELEPGVTVVRPPVEQYKKYPQRQQVQRMDDFHPGLTPHEQQMREFDLNLDFPSAYAYYTRQVRAST